MLRQFTFKKILKIQFVHFHQLPEWTFMLFHVTCIMLLTNKTLLTWLAGKRLLLVGHMSKPVTRFFTCRFKSPFCKYINTYIYSVVNHKHVMM